MGHQHDTEYLPICVKFWIFNQPRWRPKINWTDTIINVCMCTSHIVTVPFFEPFSYIKLVKLSIIWYCNYNTEVNWNLQRKIVWQSVALNINTFTLCQDTNLYFPSFTLHTPTRIFVTKSLISVGPEILSIKRNRVFHYFPTHA